MNPLRAKCHIRAQWGRGLKPIWDIVPKFSRFFNYDASPPVNEETSKAFFQFQLHPLAQSLPSQGMQIKSSPYSFPPSFNSSQSITINQTHPHIISKLCSVLVQTLQHLPAELPVDHPLALPVGRLDPAAPSCAIHHTNTPAQCRVTHSDIFTIVSSRE